MKPRQRPSYAGNDVEKVYHMLRPKPKPLLIGQRQLVRHGELGYFSPNTVSRKMRYFFLFSDCLLLTKRGGQAKFQLKIYMHLRGAIKLVTMNGSPTHEFRLLIPEKGTLKKRKERRIILFGKTEEHKQAWIRDLQRCLWEANGRKGPDPSKGPIKDTTYDEEEYQEESSSDEEPQQRRARRSTADKQAAGPKKKEIEEIEDLSDDDSSSDDEGHHGHDGHKGMGDPLIVFDPFGADGGDQGQHGQGQFGAQGQHGQYGSGQHDMYKGLDSRGQAIPKGVMLPPLSGDGSQGQATQGGYAGVGQAGGVGAYPGMQGMPGYGGVPGYSAGVSVAGYGSGGVPYGLTNPALVNPYGQGMFMPQTGVAGAGGVGGIDQTALYGAAGGVAGGLGGMFTSTGLTAPGSGGFQSAGVTAYGSGSGGHSPYGSGTDRGLEHGGGASAGMGGFGGDATGINTGSTGAQAALDDLAYKELQEATRVIESIAAELAARPRKVHGADAAPDAPMTIDHVSDAILNGTGALAKAASVLLRATAAAQKERVERDINDFHARGTPYHSDPVWANGLISAGRYVVATTQLLVDTANKLMAGEAKEEQLTACAQSVAVATTQLVVAEKTKGNLNSPTHLQLEEAAVGIRRATNGLVDAAKLHYDTQKSAQAQQQQQPQYDMSKMSMTESKVAQLEMQARLLALEAETQRAREELARLRKDEYVSPRGDKRS